MWITTRGVVPYDIGAGGARWIFVSNSTDGCVSQSFSARFCSSCTQDKLQDELQDVNGSSFLFFAFLFFSGLLLRRWTWEPAALALSPDWRDPAGFQVISSISTSFACNRCNSSDCLSLSPRT